ncbi:flagellar basal body-associated FliL family protein [Halorhodospira halochloris]|uniref:Uncharacterized protein n=1 Tax=Halorhodospira halochloris TaxID=1052 RepID=A0A0X8X905_HALHR|nr:flagellar basal body-associated FliL family protein [Halorhodospira halochloris]MBK1651393.1 hypothetical protein [Halorhodospira halochloris]MCG5531171.1 flagellar basal body-associated FliL family protein [Halorhodospira halochloris]BAU57680.1 hypothetical protein HH1059_09860 [Halorhodospira halochloris]
MVNKLLISYLFIVALVSAALAGTMGVLVAGVYVPPAWQHIGYDAIAGSPRFITIERDVEVGADHGWEEASISLSFELITRHDPTIYAVRRNMDKLHSEIAEGLAQRSPEEFVGSEGRRRLVADILRLTNDALMAEGEPARVEAVQFLSLQLEVDSAVVAEK